MPVQISSRYKGVPVYQVKDADNETHSVLGIMPHEEQPPIRTTYRHLITGVEDMEYLAWKFYGDSRYWWKIAEANELMFPLDIVPGMALVIPGVDDHGGINRNRRF